MNKDDATLIAKVLNFCAEDLTDGFGSARLAEELLGDDYTEAKCSALAKKLRGLATRVSKVKA